MKLSARLQTLVNLVETSGGPGFDHIWDTCCDHGLLGQALLSDSALNGVSQNRPVIHFVDVVPELMAQLEARLIAQMQDHQDYWQVHCQDVAQLNLLTFPPEDRHLIIIAGIGGDLMIDIIQGLLKSIGHTGHSQRLSRISFLLCPVYHHYRVRTFLAEQGLGLETEVLVEDKGRMYELLNVSFNASQPVASTGDEMWDFSRPAHLRYLKQTIKHYRQVVRRNPEAQAIIDAYLSIAPSSINL
ncbi:tRNA (adenine(22)-N(1))-methyltransferase [Litoribrevibacter albus]|uniref:SAM-dependent methyltransferase n=1 Tax=Litoribrevibacter albus TaxID=1473156 RepID=A0AA37W885_9GAMM|nr:tRNA (adenine(22)-N(1))-methyltransferase TrmK [Litoribrevibacter albus]GLQ33552.1 SAM-dependent methyltransferase [Litoribrevibacter albus]